MNDSPLQFANSKAKRIVLNDDHDNEDDDKVKILFVATKHIDVGTEIR